MKVGIDGYNLALPNGTGVATYAFMLASTLAESGHLVEGVFGVDAGRDAEMRETLFFERLAYLKREHRGRVRRWLRFARDLLPITAIDVPVTGQVETGSFADRLPSFDRIVTVPNLFERAHRHFNATGRFVTLRVERPPQIMHWTYPVPVRLAGARNIYTLHDLVPLRLPYTTLDEKRRYRALVATCIRTADHICTVSEASRADILERFAPPPEHVTNTYQISPMYARARHETVAGEGDIGNLFGLRENGYFLFFGTIEPKKNVGRLIEAYLSLHTATPLVIVAGRSWQVEQELALLPSEKDKADPRRRHLAERIVRIDYLPRRLLAPLIRGARAVTFPSLYEGFGLPVHEAMLLGTPVLTSCTGALPEVAGDAALLVDPYDVGMIAAALRRLDTDPELRTDLSARGAAHAATFSPERYAATLATMYDRVLQSLPSPSKLVPNSKCDS